MICTICNTKEVDRGTVCNTCRVRESRKKKKLIEETKDLKAFTEKHEVPEIIVDNVEESYAEWLARRCKETGSEPHTVKLGYPAGSNGTVQIPTKWTLDDIETAVTYKKSEGDWVRGVSTNQVKDF